MKKMMIPLLSALLVASMLFCGCNKNNENEDGDSNNIKYNGQSMTLDVAVWTYGGSNSGLHTHSIALGGLTTTFAFAGWTNNSSFPTGTFNIISTYEVSPSDVRAGNCMWPTFLINTMTEVKVTSGTITIEHSGNTLTLRANCTTDSGKPVEIYYTGTYTKQNI